MNVPTRSFGQWNRPQPKLPFSPSVCPSVGLSWLPTCDADHDDNTFLYATRTVLLNIAPHHPLPARPRLRSRGRWLTMWPSERRKERGTAAIVVDVAVALNLLCINWLVTAFAIGSGRWCKIGNPHKKSSKSDSYSFNVKRWHSSTYLSDGILKLLFILSSLMGLRT